MEHPRPILGTTLFDGVQARKGYALNKMCFSFNDAANRAAFLADEDAYCARFGLGAEQREAVRRRDVLALIAAGGNVYYLAKLAGICSTTWARATAASRAWPRCRWTP